ncbi:spore germination protein [Christensenellaceae bacterium NSJ-44]|uniref:Spore germination protein n=1 Tax=Luoshenia tenuis TaxID=2763654 RepID=A0A926HLK7_9FIRM|nr:spore germination protein [Luoshenia tenuis]MBC8528198.1 spore germination protein [Luoshenia tenuis]
MQLKRIVRKKKAELPYTGIDGKPLKDLKFSASRAENLAMLREIFKDIDVLKVREFANRHDSSIQGAIVYFEGLANGETVNENVLYPLMKTPIAPPEGAPLSEILSTVLPMGDISMAKDFEDLVQRVTYGDTAFFIDGVDQIVIIDTKGWQTRSISEPESEKVLRGPREGFTEGLMINLSLIRRRIRSNRLKMKFQSLGDTTHTQACLCYIEGIAKPEMVEEVKRRISTFDMDGLLDVNYLAEFITDSPYSPISTVGITEKPDVVAARLLEGRVAVLLDGTPIVLSAPYLLIESFQSDEDYYVNYLYASISRILRILAFFITISLPAIYVALVTYHQELIPTPLLISISASRQNVPFPTILETFLMLAVFDILRETGIRMPMGVGQALSIVGALVIGQATVEAKIVSAPLLIVIAMTGITGLMVPKLKSSAMIFRAFLLVLSSVLGLYGWIFGMAALLLHLLNVRSFGLPIITPLSKPSWQQLKDLAVRAPWWNMRTRPSFLSRNRVRMGPSPREKSQ